MSHSFSNVPRANIPRSAFNRSFSYKTTFDAGYLIPINVDEILPGDTVNLKLTVFARLAALLTPIMDNLYIDIFHFFVPNRLVWKNWQKFMGEQVDPGDSVDYIVPTIVSPVGGWQISSLQDYLTYPVLKAGISSVAFYTRAYNLIYNEWFRDQNLQDSVVVDTGDGPDLPANYTLLRRGKRHDYFTSCLPFPQKGPAIELPLGTSAPIKGLGINVASSGAGSPVSIRETSGVTRALPFGIGTSGSPGVTVEVSAGSGTAYPMVYADLTNATAATINSLRMAFQMQALLEADARGGTRYTEIVYAHFGVHSPDARLQRPEYLGGSSFPFMVRAVPQTSSSVDDSPQANLAATGTGAFNDNGFVKSFVEHGILMTIVSVRADLTYQQGLDRQFSRQIKYDYYWPKLSGIGEQAVLNKEIFAQGTSVDDDVFGYQERYAEYRYRSNKVTGEFRSDYAQSLDVWHLAQDFSSLPLLNASFIVDNPPVDRVIAVPTQNQVLFDSYFNVNHVRPMPTYGVPVSLGGRF